MFSRDFVVARKMRLFSFLVFSGNALALFMLLFVPSFLPASSYAEPGSVTPTLTISNSGVLSIAATPGQFSSGTQDITVSTTNYTGYTLVATASGNSDLVNTTDGAKTIKTISLPSGQESITSNSFGPEQYGYTLDGTNYKPFTSNTQIKSTNVAGTDELDFTIGVNLSLNATAGIYEKEFTFTATANEAAWNVSYHANAEEDISNMPSTNEATLSGTTLYISDKTPTRPNYQFKGWATSDSTTEVAVQPGGTLEIDASTANIVNLYAVWGVECPGICYHGNGADTGIMNDQTAAANAEVTLIASNFSKSGYGFAGWNTEPDGSGTTYGPNQTVTMPAAGYLHLYAKWIESAGNLQGWIGCSAMNTGDVTALTDTRDNQVYAIAKLADGNCWMIENMRLDPAGKTLNNTNTNNPTATFSSAVSSLSSSSFASCTDLSSTCFDQYSAGFGNVNGSNVNPGIGDQNTRWYAYGGMYNWYTATAGHGTYNKTSGDAAGDLCPNGWHLPSGGSSGELSTLDIALGGTGAAQSTDSVSQKWRAYPNNYIYSGYYDGSIAYTRNSQGYIWSKTANNSTDSHYLYFDNSNLNPGINSFSKYLGRAMRCLASPIYLQEVDNWGSSLSTGESVEAIDKRDGQVYKVSRYKMNSDGSKTALWMSNLNLGASPLNVAELNNSNTHLPTGSTISKATFESWSASSSPNSWTTPAFIPISGNDTYGNQYGTHYNFASISADTVAYEPFIGEVHRNAINDLCPAGWRLPTGGPNGEFKKLITDGYNINLDTGSAILQSDLGFSLAGSNNGSQTGVGQFGEYWSSTQSPAIANVVLNMYTFYLNTTSFNDPADNSSAQSRSMGQSARCIEASKVHNITISYGAGVANVSIDGVTIANHQTVQMEEGITYNIDMTYNSNYGFDYWSSTTGQIGSTDSKSTTYTVGSTDGTLTANAIQHNYLQSWNGCSSLAVGSSVKLWDKRDEQAYHVKKYKMSADGSRTACWIVENLNLGAEELQVNELNNSNTHMPSGSTISKASFSLWKKTSGTSSDTAPEFILGSGSDDYGNKHAALYNIAAASANTINSYDAGNQNISYDICPSGWRLPTGGANGEYAALLSGYGIGDNAAGSLALQSSLKFPLDGLFLTDRTGMSHHGYYLSSTLHTMLYYYVLYIGDSSAEPKHFMTIPNGMSIKCIAG